MLLLLYSLVLTIVAFFLMAADKKKAKMKKRRISERTLWIVAIIGGSIGILLGMYTYRHKTKHRSFTVGIPIVIIVQITFFVYMMIL